MKKLGVEFIVSVTAVGSLCGDKAPGEMVLVNQVNHSPEFFRNCIILSAHFLHIRRFWVEQTHTTRTNILARHTGFWHRRVCKAVLIVHWKSINCVHNLIWKLYNGMSTVYRSHTRAWAQLLWPRHCLTCALVRSHLCQSERIPKTGLWRLKVISHELLTLTITISSPKYKITFSSPQNIWLQACEETGVTFHAEDENTLVCIEGPSFSTIAESNLYRSWGASG